MKSRSAVRAVVGLAFCGIGLWLALPSPFSEKNYLIGAQGCELETTIVENPDVKPQGTVLLFHGISANRKIMFYLARGFAQQGLRVFLPDFPGHGRTPGPFSPARSEQCAETLLRELISQGVTTPDRTIVAGHSMGGAIALRIASRIPVAGVIAISPAPMRAAHGATPEKLLFNDPPPIPAHTLVMAGSLELESMRGNAADLVLTRTDGSAEFLEIPAASHVGILFKAATVDAARKWAAQFLQIPTANNFPSHRPIVGSMMGFVGLLLVAAPFLKEVTRGKDLDQEKDASGQAVTRIPVRLGLLEIAVGSMLTVMVLRLWIPLRPVRLFQGDYLTSYMLILGVMLLAVHWKAARHAFGLPSRSVIAAAFAGMALFLLITAWFDLTFSEAWLTPVKWARFPFLFVAILPFHLAEETLLGPVDPSRKWRRLALGLLLRLIGWGGLMWGVLYLHSGEILMGLLALYLALFNVVQRRGMDIVREETSSPGAAAIFGAILLAGFCLVIFPIT